MHRLINAMVSIGDRILFLFGDAIGRRNIVAPNGPNREPVIALIKRGQDEGAFDPELSVTWIEQALYALVRQGCEDATAKCCATPSPQPSSAPSNGEYPPALSNTDSVATRDDEKDRTTINIPASLQDRRQPSKFRRPTVASTCRSAVSMTGAPGVPSWPRCLGCR